jgi:two-component system, cell cycle sensor histidine kinase and response regulator CckA
MPDPFVPAPAHRTDRVHQLEAEWRRVLASINDCVWSADFIAGEGWSYRYLSPVIETITGRSPNEFVTDRTHWLDVIHPADRAAVEAIERELLAGRIDAVIEHRIVRPDGVIRWVRDSVRASPGENGRRLDGVVSDITDRKFAEEALREAEARHRDLLEHAPIAIYEEDFSAVGPWMSDLRDRGVTDLRAYLANRPEEVEEAIRLVRMLDANQAAVEQVGSTGKAELLAALPRLLSDQARAGFVEELATIWAGKDEFEYELRAKRLDGRPLDVILRLHVPRRDGQPDLSRVIVTCTDITARRRAEEARDREHTLLQAVLNAIPDCICFKDAKGVYQGCNSAFASLLGLTEAEVIGRTPQDLFPAEAVDKLTSLEVRLNAGGPAERLEIWLPTADGRQVLHESLRVPLPCPDGGSPGLIGISRDITDRRNLEDQLRQAGKLEAVGQLAGGIAHDFNNLLTAVLGNLSLAQSMLPSDHPTRQLLSASEQAAWRAAELTRQLLGFARRGTVRLEPAHVNTSVAETLAILRRTIDPRIMIVERTDPRLGAALADLGQVGQVLMNLCLNARDAMPADGTMTIETAHAAVDAAHVRRVATARAGRFVRLSVSDTGEGIPSEIRDRIFEPFFTTKGPGKGTGLGLALVHGIVSQHRGWIEVDSSPDRGTRFDVYLPATFVPCLPSAEVDRFAELETLCPVPPQSGTILVADDEPLILNLARTILEEHGYRVLVAADGQEGVDVYRREKGRIDLVILDLSMPRLNGRDACRQLTQIDPNIRVLLSSGYAEDTAGATRDPGVRGFVPKPYRPAELTAAVRAALNGR